MQNICANGWCKKPFELLDEDLQLLQELSPIIKGKTYAFPPRKYCVDCNHQRKALFVQGMMFYRRPSSLSGKPMIALYDPKEPFPVYTIEEWWSDKWDDTSYGRIFNFSRPFFPQFKELHNVVPKMSTFNVVCENCECCASAGHAKNCYYCSRAHHSEDMYYCEAVTGYNKNLCDCLRCQKCERCYECVQCIKCHSSSYLFRCTDTADSHFSVSLRNCMNCLFCTNLRSKQYHVRNKPVSKEEYETILKATFDGKYSTLRKNLKEWDEIIKQTIWKNLNNINCENCHGDALANSKNCYECYNCFNCIDCRYCCDLSPSDGRSSSMDDFRGGMGELIYNCTSVGSKGSYKIACSTHCRESTDILYSIGCIQCHNCFGCVGLKNRKYCILNKEYSQSEYEELLPKIIEHMRTTGEWGEFFPTDISPFPYNHSLAMEAFPLEKARVLAQGFTWNDEEPPRDAASKVIPADRLPDSIADIPDDVLNWAINCSVTGRSFKVIRQELEFQRTLNLPVHREHPDERMERRRAMLNPYKLSKRTCAKCGKAIETSYPSDSPEIVYCEECYLKEVY